LGVKRRKLARYTGFTMNDKCEIRDLAGTVSDEAIGQGDIRLTFRLRF
jgi:hypothetical protein